MNLNAKHPKFTKSRNSDSSVQIQIEPICPYQFDFVLQDTEQSEFFDLVDFGGVVCNMKVETVLIGLFD